MTSACSHTFLHHQLLNPGSTKIVGSTLQTKRQTICATVLSWQQHHATGPLSTSSFSPSRCAHLFRREELTALP